MKRLTKYICAHAHGAEGTKENNLTGSYCRGEFEATAIVDRLAAYEDTGLEPDEIQKLKAEAANGQQMKNLLSRNGFRDLSEAQAWIEQMKKLESNMEYYGKAYETPFCPAYGAPMTDEAVEIVMERL